LRLPAAHGPNRKGAVMRTMSGECDASLSCMQQSSRRQ
jgi:hypothetical protein